MENKIDDFELMITLLTDGGDGNDVENQSAGCINCLGGKFREGGLEQQWFYTRERSRRDMDFGDVTPPFSGGDPCYLS